jgi:hypothetical protein
VSAVLSPVSLLVTRDSVNGFSRFTLLLAPIRASENWNLIIRWIMLVIWQPARGTANL